MFNLRINCFTLKCSQIAKQQLMWKFLLHYFKIFIHNIATIPLGTYKEAKSVQQGVKSSITKSEHRKIPGQTVTLIPGPHAVQACIQETHATGNWNLHYIQPIYLYSTDLWWLGRLNSQYTIPLGTCKVTKRVQQILNGYIGQNVDGRMEGLQLFSVASSICSDNS